MLDGKKEFGLAVTKWNTSAGCCRDYVVLKNKIERLILLIRSLLTKMAVTLVKKRCLSVATNTRKLNELKTLR